jgi:glycosyltransferase involved in cell wall biosynthesis
VKILHVCKKYPDALGGDAVVVSNLVNQQQKSGHNVSVLTSNCDEIENSDNVYKFGLKDTSSNLDKITIKRLASLVVLFFKAYRLIKHTKPTIIHTHSVDLAFIISFAAHHYNIPIVHTFHIITFYDKKQPLIRRKTELTLARLAKPSLVTAPNNFDSNMLKEAGLGAIVFPNGIDLNFWQLSTKKHNRIEHTFISVGRLEEQKGNEFLIKACYLLSKKSATKFKVIIVGDGSLEHSLKNLVDSLGLKEYVVFAGRKSQLDIRDMYRNADTIIIPSLYETTPLTLLEGWSMGLPVISSPVGILKDMSYDKSVLSVRIGDENSLTSAMDRIMNDKRLASKLIKNGEQEVSKLSWDSIGALSLDLYKRVLVV